MRGGVVLHTDLTGALVGIQRDLSGVHVALHKLLHRAPMMMVNFICVS